MTKQVSSYVIDIYFIYILVKHHDDSRKNRPRLAGEHKYNVRHGEVYQRVLGGLVHKCQSKYASTNFGNSCISVLETFVNLSSLYL